MWVSSELGLLSNFIEINCLSIAWASGAKIKPVIVGIGARFPPFNILCLGAMTSDAKALWNQFRALEEKHAQSIHSKAKATEVDSIEKWVLRASYWARCCYPWLQESLPCEATRRHSVAYQSESICGARVTRLNGRNGSMHTRGAIGTHVGLVWGVELPTT